MNRTPEHEPRRRRPPRLAAWIVAAVIGADDGDDALGDLEERFAKRVDRVGLLRGRMWYWRQTIGFIGLLGNGTLHEGPANTHRGMALELRRVLRGLVRTPGFSAAVVGTLGLAIGATTTIFALVDGMLLRPLPYPESEELVALHATLRDDSWWSTSTADGLAWQERSGGVFSGIAWAQPDRMGWRADARAEELEVLRASLNLLEVLGVSPLMGPGFPRGADRVGGPAPVLLTYDFWQGRLGGSSGVVGTTLDLDGIAREVVGIVPEGREPRFLGRHEVIVPYTLAEDAATNRGRILRPIGRLEAGLGLTAARARMDAIARDVDRSLSVVGSEGWGVALVPLRDQVVGSVSSPLLLLLAAVGFVLLVACANVGNLLLARGIARHRELALRTALGAGRRRLAAELLLEAAILVALGGLVGVSLGGASIAALPLLGLVELDAFGPPALDVRVLVFTLAVLAFATVLSALLPTSLLSRADPASSLKSRGTPNGSGSHAGMARDALVAGEVALVLVLLAGTGLMLKSFGNLRAVDPGFDTEGGIAIQLTAPPSATEDGRSLVTYFDGLMEAISAIPGVQAVGAAANLPLASTGFTAYHIVESLPQPEPGQEPVGGFEFVSDGYFEALEIPLLEGRTFDGRDHVDSPPVVIVDEAMLPLYWPDRSPLGDRFKFGAGDDFEWAEVVGVVGAVRYALSEDPRPRAYAPHGQINFGGFRRRSLVVRTDPGLTQSVMAAIPPVIAASSPDQAITSIQTLQAVSGRSTARVRFETFVMAGFGLTGLILALTGIYGLVSYTVSRRFSELGVRVALGAERASILGLVVRQGLVPVGAGVGIGTVGGVLLTRALTDLLFGLDPLDPGVWVATIGLVIICGVTAALVPGLRAVRLDPVAVLRPD